MNATVQPLAGEVSCDVAIVGYGPVGMVCAALLAQRGLDVIVIERHPQRFGLPRAGHLDGETMRTFQQLGIAEAVELVARPMLEWGLVTAEMEVLATVRLGESGSGWKADYLSYQPEFEEIIDKRARQLGVRVEMGMTAIHLQQSVDAVQLTARATNSLERPQCKINAAYVIGADGASSFVRSAIGVERRDLGFRAMDHLVLDFEHSDPDRDMPGLPEVYQVLDINRPTLAGRWSGSRWSRWEFAAKEGESRDYLESEETCFSLLAKWGITRADGKINRRAVYSFESTLAAKWRNGRVILIGDAAHTMPPFMGQGMCTGVRDAVNIAWKIADVLSRKASDALLDTYEIERAPHARDMIDMSIAVGELVLVTDPEKARLRDDMLRSGEPPRPPLFPRLIAGIVRPPNAANSSEADGRPALQARVAMHGRVDRLDNQFPHPGWRLVSRHPVPENLFDRRQHALMSALEIQIAHISRGPGTDHFIDIDGEYDLWFRKTGLKAFLQRPDNYVFGTAKTIEELPALLDELATSLRMSGWHVDDVKQCRTMEAF